MINYERYRLPNGLRVILHQDKTTPMVAVNVLYDVGSRHESKEKTGFAHLFEHLMFSGSVNAPEYDTPLQLAGGESNAYTSADITNYYAVVPRENLDTVFFLESDRMQFLVLDQDKMNIQKQVVIEEFKENYLNEPFGDAWHHLLDMAYHDHPYNWPSIGKIPQHIESVELDELKAFYRKFYSPANAILVVCGKY